MFDMRYHIASLVAVFLALTVGLLLGSLVADKGLLADRQEKLVESIRVDISKMADENAALRTKTTQLEQFQNEVLPVAVRGRLVDKKIVVATLVDGQEEAAAGIDQALKTAGADVFPMRIKVNELNFSNKALVSRLARSFDTSPVAGGAFERLFWSRLAAEISGKAPSALISALRADDLVSLDASAVPVETMVILAPTKKQVSNRDALLLEALAQVDSVRVIGGEKTDTEPSRVTAYKLKNFSTVDNIETVPGKIALVYLLENRELTAHYGAKSTADELMP